MQLNEAAYMKKSAKIKFVLVHKCLSHFITSKAHSGRVTAGSTFTHTVLYVSISLSSFTPLHLSHSLSYLLLC